MMAREHGLNGSSVIQGATNPVLSGLLLAVGLSAVVGPSAPAGKAGLN
jgi:hypothetical protein